MSADQPVTLTDQERDRDALARTLMVTLDCEISLARCDGPDLFCEVHDAYSATRSGVCGWALRLADATLDSDWLAERDRAAFERGRQALAAQVRELHRRVEADWQPGFGYCRECGGGWPCKTAAVLPPVPVDAHTSSEQGS